MVEPVLARVQSALDAIDVLNIPTIITPLMEILKPKAQTSTILLFFCSILLEISCILARVFSPLLNRVNLMTDLALYRNIGIFAHVDAGKTTTT